jgi:hypothetical protein
MFFSKKKLLLLVTLILSAVVSPELKAESNEINEVLEKIQKDLRTLEKAVYASDSFSNTISLSDKNDSNTNLDLDQNSEEVLTRHLLKLSEIETQFQKLTNKFEEINFKLDKLSTRLSKVQADNQLRFQQLENNTALNNNLENQEVSSINAEDGKEEILPGSSQPQDLGSISYKDSETDLKVQQTQSIDSTTTV